MKKIKQFIETLRGRINGDMMYVPECYDSLSYTSGMEASLDELMDMINNEPEEGFISEDKMTITLPVPLGTKVYYTLTKCGDFCMFQKEHFNKTFGEKEGGHCDCMMPCHTRYREPQEMEVTLNTLKFVIENWGTKVFATYDEADSVTKLRIGEHIHKMAELGFEMDDKGYSAITKEAKDE